MARPDPVTGAAAALFFRDGGHPPAPEEPEMTKIKPVKVTPKMAANLDRTKQALEALAKVMVPPHPKPR